MHYAPKRGSREYVQSKNAALAAMVQPQQYLLQVCTNGHKITEHFGRKIEDDRDFCPTCGAPTTTTCPACETEMLGCMHYPHVVGGCDDVDIPEYCNGCGKPYPWTKKEAAAFLEADFGSADAKKLTIADEEKTIIQDRLDEAGKGLKADMPVSVVFSCGSAVEGMLFAYASSHQRLYNQAGSAPKDLAGRTRPLIDWRLNDLINVAKEVGHIGHDTKVFAEPLKGFRNYIHPREQLRSGFKPTLYTAQICYQVTKSVIHDLEQV